jgi:hypothetical protein
MGARKRCSSGAAKLVLKSLVCAVALVVLPLMFANAQLSASDQFIHGTVRDTKGAPVPFAYVFAAGISAVTSQSGAFTIKTSGQLPVGTVVTVRRLGFSPSSVVFTDSLSRNIGITLSPLETALATVTVIGKTGDYDEYLDRFGYYRRSAKAVDGTFISDADIIRRNPMHVTQVLRNIAGVRVISRAGKAGQNDFPVGRGGLCALGLVVDNQRVRYHKPSNADLQPRMATSMLKGSPPPLANDGIISGNTSGSFDEMIGINQVKAIEVYPSAASVPNDLQQHIVDGCGLVVVWTKYQ